MNLKQGNKGFQISKQAVTLKQVNKLVSKNKLSGAIII